VAIQDIEEEDHTGPDVQLGFPLISYFIF